MLSIQNLSVSIDTKLILKHCSLSVKVGQIHVLMGPNGSGKSSLVYTLMGHPAYQIDQGIMSFEDHDLTTMPTHERSLKGMYLSMQQPCSITGLQVLPMLQELYAAHTNTRLNNDEFMLKINPLLKQVGLAESILYRCVNDNFSGGERKRFELLQMMLLKPKLALLDEIDSGVDIDGLKLIAQGLQDYQKQNPQTSMIIVTHYRRILQYLQPDVVHIMKNGTIVDQGDATLIDIIEHKGYEQYEKRSE